MLENLIGQHFGELEVIDYNEETKKWICKCSCGKTTEVLGYNLKLGNTKSCGHLKNAVGVKKNKSTNILNKTIGLLSVIDLDTNKHIATVKCLQCGKISKMKEQDLIEMKKSRKKTFTCGKNGCHYENPRKKNNKIQDGTRFGKLVVLKRLENKIIKTEKSETSIPMYLCKCDCGNKIEVQGRYLLDGRTKSCGCLKKSNFENRKKYSQDITFSSTNKKIYDIYMSWQKKYRQPTELFKKRIIDNNIKFFPELKDKENPFVDFCNWAIINGFSLKKRQIYLERKDYTKDFCVTNCFWTTIKTKGY